MLILNSHGLSQMKVMGLIGFWYWAYKQWGFEAKTTSSSVVSFPITFKSVLFIGTFSTNLDSAYCEKIKEYSTADATTWHCQGRYGGFWLAGGTV